MLREDLQILGQQQKQVMEDHLLGHRVYSTSQDVACYQQQLNRILSLVPPLEIDGQKGQKTVNALYAFQKKYNLPINGMFDQRTISTIRGNDPLRYLKVDMLHDSESDSIIKKIAENFDLLINNLKLIVQNLQTGADMEASFYSCRETKRLREKIKNIVGYKERTLLRLKRTLQESLKLGNTQLKSIHNSIVSAIKSYNFEKRSKELMKQLQSPNPVFADSSMSSSVEKRNLKFIKGFSKVSNKLYYVGYFLSFLSIIIHLCHYEDTPEWHRQTENFIFEFLDQILLVFIAIILATVIIAAGSSAPFVLLTTIISFVGGLIIFFFEENDIYPSKCITEFISGFRKRQVVN